MDTIINNYDSSVIRAMLDAEANVTNNDDETALLLATKNGRPRVPPF